MKDEIKKILTEQLSATYIHVEDNSSRHAGHPEAAGSGGGHYHVTVVSQQFEGLPPIQRHRKVYDGLKEKMRGQIHALAITALTPSEYAKRKK